MSKASGAQLNQTVSQFFTNALHLNLQTHSNDMIPHSVAALDIAYGIPQHFARA
jgi:hypothetical protein